MDIAGDLFGDCDHNLLVREDELVDLPEVTLLFTRIPEHTPT